MCVQWIRERRATGIGGADVDRAASTMKILRPFDGWSKESGTESAIQIARREAAPPDAEFLEETGAASWTGRQSGASLKTFGCLAFR
jgi:hypothetical protein